MHARQHRLPVPDALRPWIDRIDIASYRTDDNRPLVHAPDPATVLVWRTTVDGEGAVLVMGPRTHATYHDSKTVPLCVRIRIGSGAAPTLLGTSVDRITDDVVPLGELWGPAGDQLGSDLAGLGSQPRLAVERIETALLARVERAQARERDRANLVRHASVELCPSPGCPQPLVSDVARHVGVSERHLRDLFTATVGVPPKQFVRLNRIRTILPSVRRGSWAPLASAAGYYDQSHMTAHFREVMHVTPSDFVAGRLPTVPC